MTSWALVALVAIVVWGIVQLNRSRRITDKRNRETMQDEAETQAEIEALRERIRVLERIATDGNSLDARETQRLSAEIDALREKRAAGGSKND